MSVSSLCGPDAGREKKKKKRHRGALTSIRQVVIGHHNVVPVLVVDPHVFAIWRLRHQSAGIRTSHSGERERGATGTHVGYHSDVHVPGLLGGERRRLVAREGIRHSAGVAPPRFIGDLLPGRPLPFLAGLHIVFIEAVRRQRAERCGSRRVDSRICPVARRRLAGRVGSDNGTVVHRVVGRRLVVSFPLLGRRAIRAVGGGRGGRRMPVGQGLRGGVRLLRLGRVLDDDDLLGQTVLVKILPVRLSRPPPLAGGSRLGQRLRLRRRGHGCVEVVGSRCQFGSVVLQQSCGLRGPDGYSI